MSAQSFLEALLSQEKQERVVSMERTVGFVDVCVSAILMRVDTSICGPSVLFPSNLSKGSGRGGSCQVSRMLVRGLSTQWDFTQCQNIFVVDDDWEPERSPTECVMDLIKIYGGRLRSMIQNIGTISHPYFRDVFQPSLESLIGNIFHDKQ